MVSDYHSNTSILRKPFDVVDIFIFCLLFPFLLFLFLISLLRSSRLVNKNLIKRMDYLFLTLALVTEKLVG